MAATLDKDLTTTLKAARGGKPMQFAFLPKGSEGKLLIGKKILPKQIAETKKETGASSVFKGRCVGEDGTLVFYVAKEPPGTLLGQLRKRLKEDAGVTSPIEIRVSSDAEAEPAEGEAAAAGAAAAPGAPPSPRAAWEKALAAVEPAYLQGLSDQPDKASALRAVMGFAQGKAAKEDFPGAIAALRKLAEQLARSPTNGAKTAPGPEPVSPAGADLAAQWKAKLAEYTPALKAALAAKGPNAAAIAKLLAQATALSKPGGDMAQALAKLTECHKLATGPAPTSPGGADLTAQWKAKLAEYTPALKAALAAKGPNAAAIAKLLAQATALSKPGGDMAQALEKLTECHALATGGATPAELAHSAKGEGAPKEKDKPSFVNYAKARLDWMTTRQKVAADLQKLEQAILEVYKGTPSFAAAQAAVRNLDKVLKHFDESLADKLDEALNAADENVRAALNKQAAAIVARYTNYLHTDPMVTQLDGNPFVPLSVQDDLSTTLTDLAAQLS
jgi:hypothetical protein